MFKMFFPITGLFFDPFLIFFTGLFGGFLSGLLGVGCGVIVTPVLMELGIPPMIAVSTQLCHAVGTNMTNFLSYKRNRDVDFHLASYILFGAFLGALCEWMFIKYSSGTKATVNKFMYIYVIVVVLFGIVMLTQSIKEWRQKLPKKYNSPVMMRRWMLYLPFHRIFVRSRAEMSVIIPIFVGFLAGLLVASLGGGNNLFMAPIITYLIGRISPVVYGTTALAGWLITAIIAVIYSERGYCCDMTFVFILFAGAAIGSFFGVRLTYTIKRSYINATSAIFAFIMASRQIFRIFSGYTPRHQTSSVDFSKSVIFKFAAESYIVYTMICVCLISIVAFFLEKSFQFISDKRKRKKEDIEDE